MDFASSGLAPILPFHNRWVGIYWLTAIPIGFVLCIWFFRRTASMSRVVAAATATTGILTLIVASSGALGWPLLVLPGDLTDRGLVGLLVIAVGLAVWAYAERSQRLWTAVGVFLVLALVSCRYDISNVAGFGSSPSAAELPNVVFPGLYLLLGGLTFWLLERRLPRTAPT